MENQIILILGKNGQVASALKEILGDKAISVDRNEINFLNPTEVVSFITKVNPDIVINTAAYTAVDKAESEPNEAELINHQTPSAIAQWIATNNKLLVHYSTDYVYEGSGSLPHSEFDNTLPLSCYARTKLAGDNEILKSGARALILRTSWVYSHIGKNFFLTMLKLGSERENLSIVCDQIGSPTYAPDLAELTIKILNHPNIKNHNGAKLYNVCGTGYCSWFEFAEEIFRIAPEFSLPIKINTINKTG